MKQCISRECLLKQKWTKSDSIAFIKSHNGFLGPDGYYRICYYGKNKTDIIKIVNDCNFKEVKYSHNIPMLSQQFDIIDFVKKVLNVSHKETLDIIEQCIKSKENKIKKNECENTFRHKKTGCFYVKNITCYVDEESEVWVSYDDIENMVYPLEERPKKFNPQGLWGVLGVLYTSNVLSMNTDAKYIHNKLCFNVKTLKQLLKRQLNKKGKNNLILFCNELDEMLMFDEKPEETNQNNNYYKKTDLNINSESTKNSYNLCFDDFVKKFNDITKQYQSEFENLINLIKNNNN